MRVLEQYTVLRPATCGAECPRIKYLKSLSMMLHLKAQWSELGQMST